MSWELPIFLLAASCVAPPSVVTKHTVLRGAYIDYVRIGWVDRYLLASRAKVVVRIHCFVHECSPRPMTSPVVAPVDQPAKRNIKPERGGARRDGYFGDTCIFIYSDIGGGH
jgi:hypothetical protein